MDATRLAKQHQGAADSEPYPSGRFLYVVQRAKDPAVLARMPVAGGAAEPIAIPDGVYFSPSMLAVP